MSEGLNIHQIQEIRREIELIKNLLTDLEPKTKRINSRTQEQIRLLTASLSLTHRMGLPDDVDASIVKIQRMISLLLQLRLTLLAVQAAAGPYGWALAGVTAVTTIITATDTVGSLG